MKTQVLGFVLIVLISCSFQLASAQIVYTDVNPDTTSAYYALDLNLDGITDFTLYNTQFSHQCGLNICTQTVTDNTYAISPAGSNQVANQYSGGVSRFDLNATISSALLWKNSASQILYSTSYHCTGDPLPCCCTLSSSGAWGYQVGYIGLQLIANGKTYYGWVKGQINYGGITVEEFAYNTVPEQSILTGQTSCMTVTTADAKITASGATTFCAPGGVTLKVDSSGYSYQWRKDGTSILNAVYQSYYAAESGSYTCKVSGCGGSKKISNAILVTDASPNAVVSPSGTVNICQGQSTILSANSGLNLSYQWKKDNNNISGATNSTLLVSEAGKYKVKVTESASGCSTTSKSTQVSITCKEMIDEEDIIINVYPNLVSKLCAISITLSSVGNLSLQIFDVQGKLIRTLAKEQMSEGAHTLTWNARDENGNEVSDGIYFLRMETEHEVKTIAVSVAR